MLNTKNTPENIKQYSDLNKKIKQKCDQKVNMKRIELAEEAEAAAKKGDIKTL